MSSIRDQIDNDSQSSLHNLRGIDLAERGFIEEAIKQFKLAVNNAPNSAQGHDNLGTAYADRGDWLQALTSYVAALNLEPENPIVLHNLGCLLLNHANELSIRCFKKASKLDPELYEAHYNLGLCFAAEDKHEQAIMQFERALSEEEDAEVHFQLASSLYALKRYPSAIRELLAALKIDKKHEQAWFYLGLSYQEQGFLEEALNAFIGCVKLAPDHLEAVLSMASMLIRLDRIKESKPLIKRAMKIDPKCAEEFIAQDDYLCNYKSLNSNRNK